jgi:predicted phage tail protein
MSNLSKVRLHGYLGEKFGHEWELDIKNVAEALRAIDVNRGDFLKTLMENDCKGIRYKLIINSTSFYDESYEQSKNLNRLKDTELFINKRIETLDIVPCLEGAGGFASIFFGATLSYVGYSFSSSFLLTAGLGLVFQGVSNLLATPPKFEEFREIQQINKRQSYLFNGPQNSVSEGGPIPIGYGRLIIGSQLVSYNTTTFDKAF